jgi:hypothetical protein
MKKIFLFVTVLFCGMSIAATAQLSTENQNFPELSEELILPISVDPSFLSEEDPFSQSADFSFLIEGEEFFDQAILNDDRPGGEGGTGGEVPVGDGIWVLALTGGAYALLLNRKRITSGGRSLNF